VLSPQKFWRPIEVAGCLFVPSILDTKTELLVDMKADTDYLTQQKQHDHGHQTVPSDLTLRVKALESLLVEKGLVEPAALDALIDVMNTRSVRGTVRGW
jgi:hypothetical protein